MNKTILEFLYCPSCHSDLKLNVDKQDKNEVETGILICIGCNTTYPITEGIPRIIPKKILDLEKKTTNSFGFAWKYYGPQLSKNLNTEFLTLVKPWKESDFKDKIVLDVGCGAGRLSRLASEYGAKNVFSIDLGRAVDTAKKLSIKYPNINFVQASLFSLPFKIKFDIIFSMGVLHHTPSPSKGFKSIFDFLKNGGKIGVWVYGKEGNEIMGPLMNIFRFITIRLNHWAKVFLAFIIVRLEELFYNIISRITKKFFYQEYLNYFNKQLSRADREYVVFDFMSTHLVKYISQKEIKSWSEENNLKDVNISQRNQNSWSLTGIK